MTDFTTTTTIISDYPTVDYLLGITLIVILLIGLAANTLTALCILIIGKHGVLANIFVGHRIVADFFLLLINLPFAIVHYMSTKSRKERTHCGWFVHLSIVSILVYIYSNTAVTINRYVFLCKPLVVYKKHATVPRAIAIIMFTWIWCLMLSLLPSVLLNYQRFYGFSIQFQTCFYLDGEHDAYITSVVLFFALGFLPAFCCLITLELSIYHKLILLEKSSVAPIKDSPKDTPSVLLTQVGKYSRHNMNTIGSKASQAAGSAVSTPNISRRSPRRGKSSINMPKSRLGEGGTLPSILKNTQNSSVDTSNPTRNSSPRDKSRRISFSSEFDSITSGDISDNIKQAIIETSEKVSTELNTYPTPIFMPPTNRSDLPAQPSMMSPNNVPHRSAHSSADQRPTSTLESAESSKPIKTSNKTKPTLPKTKRSKENEKYQKVKTFTKKSSSGKSVAGKVTKKTTNDSKPESAPISKSKPKAKALSLPENARPSSDIQEDTYENQPPRQPTKSERQPSNTKQNPNLQAAITLKLKSSSNTLSGRETGENSPGSTGEIASESKAKLLQLKSNKNNNSVGTRNKRRGPLSFSKKRIVKGDLMLFLASFESIKRMIIFRIIWLSLCWLPFFVLVVANTPDNVTLRQNKYVTRISVILAWMGCAVEASIYVYLHPLVFSSIINFITCRQCDDPE